MYCTKCGNKNDVEAKFCNSCGEECGKETTPAKPTSRPIPRQLPGAWLLLLSGIGDIIVGAIFIVIGLAEVGYIGLEFSSVFWFVIGGIILGVGVQNIMRRNNFEKIAEIRTAMITGIIILSVAVIYFIVMGTLSFFFIAIILPDIIGLIGAQINHNYAKKFNENAARETE